MAALVSALAVWPQATQPNADWLRRLQGMDWHRFEPIHFGPKLRDFAALAGESECAAQAPPVAALFQGEVVDEPASARDLRHLSGLLRRRAEAEHCGFTVDQWGTITWPMMDDNACRPGRHCVFAMHLHLVFATKYRRHVLTKAMLDDMRDIFASVCADFEAGLVERDGEDDHVHLRVNYPPKVAVSALVKSLKGVSSRLMRQRHPALVRR